TLLDRVWDAAALDAHRRCLEDHLALRALLVRNDWVAFVADGSRLARRSGEEDTPMEEGNVPFVAPPEMAAEVDLPHAGRIRGTAIPRGITLLCGGGFHGKSTLLRALAAAVHPHVPGDGRERVACDPTALAIRAEDGRAITGIDLRPFLRSLPSGHDLARFTTGNASGSTSQAAAILEALAAGSCCLLIDEDTSATNFLLRDPWMAKLLDEDREPIVPLLARLREIHDRFGVSTILVVGGSGEAFRIADRALMMNAYRAEDATARMLQIREAMGEGTTAAPTEWPPPERRLPLDRLRRSDPRVKAVGARKLLVGRSEVDLGASGALVHPSQARTLATILSAVLSREGPAEELPALAEWAADRIETRGAGAFSPFPRGDLAEVRAQEIAMLFNRLRYGAGRGRPSPPGTEAPSRG
ncbi:MAG: ATPase, partial [Candidatus Eisenbacteria bacterium]|nr:ATPase [Candidatus Latescibacterota bacterium]MBD3301993.1 ATPase [Candidatus Eisenbacteria bacterium]